MYKAAIISKPQKPELATILPELIGWLKAHDYETLLDPQSALYASANDYASASNAIERVELPRHEPNIVIVLGGDGTLLAAARAFAHSPTPILGINLGSLGFLTEVPLSELYSALEAWCDNCASVEQRDMMYAELVRDGKVVRHWDALNDIVVSKGNIARMADFSVEIDQQFVAAMRADGIIVSTPTGSTAYNLSAGGPIVMPSVSALVVTPLCPHLLTLRPFVVPGDSSVTITIKGAPHLTNLTIDGQDAIELTLGDKVTCRRSDRSVRLLRPRRNGLFNVLRSKLSWGEQ
jgi:NAD+ kinase